MDPPLNLPNHKLHPSLPSPSAQQKATLASLEKEAALKRLHEAEARLRQAIHDLHSNHGPHDWYQSLFSSTHPLCRHSDSCIANCLASLCQSFLLAYGVRVGIGVLLRAFKLAKNNKSYLSILDLKLLLSERNLIVREEACRIGLLFGGFSGCYHGMNCILRRIRGKETPLNSFLAGGVAGLSIMSLDNTSRRRTLALYFLARLVQCVYNSMKVERKFLSLRRRLKHGDMLVFALACAQVMYAYVMCPESLPEPYIDFIVQLGPIAKPILEAVRKSCRREPIDVMALSEIVSNRTGGRRGTLEPNCNLVPCSIIHADTTCMRQINNAMYSSFRKIFPLYMSFRFVPFVVLNIQKFMESPMSTIWNSFSGAIRSACFLSVFVGIYQSYICLQRKLVATDHKLVYWFGGALASLSILLERKSQRAELALYVLSNAANSLFYILLNRHIVPQIAYAEVVIFCLCTGAIMYFYEHEPQTLPLIFSRLINRFLNPNVMPGQPLHNIFNYADQLPSISAQDSRKNAVDHPEDVEMLKVEAFHGL